ncbi:unnamed protein product [Didymodactylos carnosus]|uniref:Uncharacterized protein n=1 Tax=Didymodactylos carnosus TaxID=1234261 RepID=A0A814EKV4_9BILA|nr:unnamed protein product [Didymodactylos carnosus]CAF1564034.1 unnamed protein product [Didymodactylos carnosus]CAF3743911.1 unnamed protein product [Didymodactylos carnosus]CAF4356629.1 unnamed protein product [Didymodactylos carnosus]
MLTNNNGQSTAQSASSSKHDKPLSQFYLACKEGDLQKVTRILKTYTIDDINRIEPHGSTALHVASFNGHAQIVRLLLDVGAARNLLNNYGSTPYEEAEKYPEIRRMFERFGKSE